MGTIFLCFCHVFLTGDYSQLSSCRHLAIVDNTIIQTETICKSLGNIITDIWLKQLPLLRMLTRGPGGVRNKGVDSTALSNAHHDLSAIIRHQYYCMLIKSLKSKKMKVTQAGGR